MNIAPDIDFEEIRAELIAQIRQDPDFWCDIGCCLNWTILRDAIQSNNGEAFREEHERAASAYIDQCVQEEMRSGARDEWQALRCVAARYDGR